MSSLVVAVVFSCAVLGQVAGPSLETASVEELEQAVRQLSDARFAERERASQFLWRQGKAARAALEEATNSNDAEVRSRARKILEDFDYGVLPGTPPEILILIDQFRMGDAAARVEAVQKLLQGERLELAANLLRKERDANVRHTLLAQVINDPRIVDKFIETKNIEALVEAVGADQQADWRAAMMVRLLFAPKMIQRLAERGELEQVGEALDQEKNESQRYQRVAALVADQETVLVLLERDQVAFLLALIGKQTQAILRQQLLSSMLGRPRVMDTLVERRQWKQVWQFSRENLPADSHLRIANQLFQNSQSITGLLKDPGLEKLVEFIVEEEDPALRGRLLAQLVSSSALRQSGAGTQGGELARKLLDDLPPESRLEYLRGFFRGGAFHHYASTQVELKQKLWEHAVSDPDPRWRAQMCLLLIALAGESPSPDQANELVLELFDVAERDPPREPPAVGAFAPPAAVMDQLLSNHHAMTILIAQGKGDDLFSLIVEASDEVRAARLGRMLQSRAFMQHLQNTKQVHRLVEIAGKETENSIRHAYLLALFSSDVALTAILEDGRYQALWKLADECPDPQVRPSLLAGLLVHAKATEQVRKDDRLDLLLSLPKDLDTNQQRRFLTSLLRNEPLVMALLDADRAGELLSLLGDTKDRYAMGSAVQALFSNVAYVKRLRDKQQLAPAVDLLAQDQYGLVWQSLGSFYPRSGNGPESVLQILLDAGQFDNLLAAVQQQTNLTNRGRHLGRLVSHPATLEHLAKKKRLVMVVELAASQPEGVARHAYRTNLLSETGRADGLIEHGLFDELLEMIRSEPDATRQATMLAQLLTADKALERLRAGNQLDLLLESAEQMADDTARSSYLNRVAQSSQAMRALLERNQFDRFYTLCDSQGNADTRRRVLAGMLHLPEVSEHLANTDRLASSLEALLAEPDANTRWQQIRQLIYSASTIRLLAKHGELERLATALQDNDALRGELLVRAAATPEGIEFLVADNRFDQLLPLLENTDPQRGSLAGLLPNLLNQPKLVEMLLEQGHYDRLTALIRTEKNDAVRQSRLTTFQLSPAVIAYLANQGKANEIFEQAGEKSDPNLRDRYLHAFVHSPEGPPLLAKHKLAAPLVELLKSDPDTSKLPGYAMRAGDARLRQTLISSGQIQPLRDLASLHPDAAQRANLERQILFPPSGLVPYLLSRGEFPEAEKLLEEHATNDLGQLRLATYLAASDKLDERITTLRTALDAKKEADPRLLVYLFRARGDLAAAREAAEAIGDTDLVKALVVEQRDWDAAVRLQADGSTALPIPVPDRTPAKDEYRRAEHLGTLAAYQRLAGQSEALANTLEEIRRLADSQPNDRMLSFFCVEALLLNGRPDDGLALMKRSYPARAFDLLVERQQYAAALDLVGWSADTVPGSAWLDSLPVSNDNANEAALGRFELALRISRLLHLLGQRGESERLFDFLETHVQAMPAESTDYRYGPGAYWERLCEALLRTGSKERAWLAGGRAVTRRIQPTPPLPRLYSSRSEEARAWWLLADSGAIPGLAPSPSDIAGRPSNESGAAEANAAKLEWLDRVLNPPFDESGEKFAELVGRAEQHAAKLHETQRPIYLRGIAQTCLRRGQGEIARRLLEPLVESSIDAARLLAKQALDESAWSEAAERYEAIWQQDREQTAALYLAGVARASSGRSDDDAANQKHLALRMALDAASRHRLAVELHRHQLNEAAADQFRLLLRIAPSGHWHWHDAARHLTEPNYTSDPAEVANFWELYLLGDLRTAFRLLDDRFYLRLPAKVHHLRATAALADGDAPRAEREALAALQFLPGQSAVAEELVPGLQQAGHTDQADRVFDKLFDHYARLCAKFPDCALAHNNLAWVSARCHRRLDDALTHAETAVRLEPENAGYLDTLAEVHFHRGDRPAAVKYAEQAVQLQPRHTELRKQLERFRNEPVPVP